MSTELQVWTPPGLPTKDEFETMRSMAIIYAKSSAVRDCFRGNPENCFIAVSVGRELGIPPTLALSKGYVIDGGYQLEADVLGDIIRRNIPGLSWEVVDQNDDLCTIRGGIAGQREHTVTFTFEMAKAAGWTEGRNGIKNQWKPGARQDTMYAKCVRRLAKRTGGLWASLYTVDPEEKADDTLPPVKHEPSGATVVIDGQRVGEFAPAGSGVDHPVAATSEAQPAATEKPKKVEVGEDWQYRLLRAFAVATRLHSDQYAERLDDPPTKQPGRTRWAKANSVELMRTINRYYTERSEKPIKDWGMFPPRDAENVALWLEQQNAKGAGTGGGTTPPPAATTADPAPEKEPDGDPADLDLTPAGAGAETGEQDTSGAEDAPLPDEEPDTGRAKPDQITAKTGEIADGSLEELLGHFDTLRLATKGARRYYQKHSTSGNWYLTDATFLKELGHTKDGVPISQRLDNLWGHEADRIMLARLVAEELFREVKR